ncbi:hypothetical protein RTM1035_05160 [Roseovarius sp. TM1035]|jgi:hypothetical protein|uniref:hypothetical protein n=1 Tax=Roseovarius sp. TM1035 TaxID=391613 RepID=UPI0001556B00|nr:hypothetical protein [Roseovarius sp. TM1035]AWZ21099.1 Hypothetical protein RAK1035_2391 [Roseovarius sp. AK1035]EDM32979.1 hypothetical protein RTM1035_05160 [Roseovarius sp. TM1035]
MENDPLWVDEMRADLGDALVERFLLRAGGMRLYVPGTLRTKSQLTALGGQDIARWISDRYAGDYVDVPSIRAQTRDGLRHALREAPDTPVNELANRFGVTARRVLQVKAALAEEEEPPLLKVMRRASSE